MSSRDIPDWPPDAEVYTFEDLPLQRDTFLLGESQMLELHRRWLLYLAEPDGTSPPHPNQFISYRMSAIETVRPDSCEVNVCIDQSSRFHVAVMTLPRSKFVACVRFWNYQKRPYLVVSQDWFDDIERLLCSQYALVDVVGMRRLLEREGRINGQQVTALREGIDEVAEQNKDHAFLAFADSVVVKTNWSVADATYRQSYRPERFLAVVNQIAGVFKRCLDLPAYSVVTQGSNQWVEESLLKVSESQNHVFFGSLGTPFAELFEIDQAVRTAIRRGWHAPHDLYLSHAFFLTLNFTDWKKRDQVMKSGHSFESKMTVPDFSTYHPFKYDDLVGQITEPRPRQRPA